MSEKFWLDRKIGFQNMVHIKSINVIIDSIGPIIILRSIYKLKVITYQNNATTVPPVKSDSDVMLFFFTKYSRT